MKFLLKFEDFQANHENWWLNHRIRWSSDWFVGIGSGNGGSSDQAVGNCCQSVVLGDQNTNTSCRNDNFARWIVVEMMFVVTRLSKQLLWPLDYRH